MMAGLQECQIFAQNVARGVLHACHALVFETSLIALRILLYNVRVKGRGRAALAAGRRFDTRASPLFLLSCRRPVEAD